MREVRIVIIEDQRVNIDQLKEYLDLFPINYQIEGIARKLSDGKKLLLTTQPDLVFIDMKLPDGEGIELLEKFPVNQFQTIFFTAHKDYALAAFEKGSIDYLLKPLELEAFSRAMKKFLKDFDQENKIQKEKSDPIVSIPHKEGTLYLPLNEIYYFQAYGEYCYLISQEKKSLVPTTLKTIESKLPQNQFCRIHRSYLVNVQKIRYYQKRGMPVLSLTNGEELPISRRRSKEIEGFLEQLP